MNANPPSPADSVDGPVAGVARSVSATTAASSGRVLDSDAHTWVATAARCGHLGIGLIYIVVGAIAFGSTAGSGMRAVGFQGALRRLLEMPTGPAVFAAIAVGLLADGVWQGFRAALNIDMAEPGPRGYVERTSWVVSGLVHLGLGMAAVKLAMGFSHAPAEGALRYWTQSVLSLPFGEVIIAVAGGSVIVAGAVFIMRALIGGVDRPLDLSSLKPLLRAIVNGLGRFGIAVRGAVFIVIGFLLVSAAVHVNAREARGLGGALRTIQSQPFGRFLLAAVALGLIAYGLFELSCARWRHVGNPVKDLSPVQRHHSLSN